MASSDNALIKRIREEAEKFLEIGSLTWAFLAESVEDFRWFIAIESILYSETSVTAHLEIMRRINRENIDFPRIGKVQGNKWEGKLYENGFYLRSKFNIKFEYIPDPIITDIEEINIDTRRSN